MHNYSVTLTESLYAVDDIRARQVKYHLQSIVQIIDCHHKGNRFILQLMNEADYLMKNYGDRGRCYPSRP